MERELSLKERILVIKQASILVAVLFKTEEDAEWFLDNGEIAVTLLNEGRNKTLQPYINARRCVCDVMAGPGRFQMFELAALDVQGKKKISLRIADEIIPIQTQ